MIKTVCVQIGNTDDKLTQKEWSDFCKDVKVHCDWWKKEIHFCGTSEGSKPWQNMCIVFTMTKVEVEAFAKALNNVRKKYNQESIAVLVGDTEFVF